MKTTIMPGFQQYLKGFFESSKANKTNQTTAVTKCGLIPHQPFDRN